MRQHTVGEIMTNDVISVPAETRFRDIVQVMADHAVGVVPVVDAEGTPLGIISEADLLHKEEFKDWQSDSRPLWERKARRQARQRSEALSAREVMTSPVITVSQHERIAEAARIMAQHRIKHLPVTDHGGHLIGIVARGDLLRIFLRPDEEIREEIIEEVVRHALWEDPEQLHVTVTDGSVLLSGTVAVASTVPFAVRLTQSIDGVIDVREELTYERDDRKDLNTRIRPHL